MNNFPLAGKPVTHPSWCDPERCTAPETYPAEYVAGGRQYHRSAPLGGELFEGDQIYLSQSGGAPWECSTYLIVEAASLSGSIPRRLMVTLDTSSPLLWAILGQATDLDRDFRLLMENEAAKRGRTWRPLTAGDELPEPRATNEPAAAAAASPLVDGDSVDERETTSAEIVEDDGAPLTLEEYQSALSYWERKAEEAKAAGDQATLAYRLEGAATVRQTIQRMQNTPATRSTGDPGGPYWMITFAKNERNARPEISMAVAATTAPAAEQLWQVVNPGCRALNLNGPFTQREEAYAYRSAWLKTEGR